MSSYTPLTTHSPHPNNRKWLLGGGCGILALIGFCMIAIIGFAVGIVFFAFGAIRSSDVYQQALTQAQDNRAVIEALGQPVEPGWFVSGSIESGTSTGAADFQIPLSGPKGSGTLYVAASKTSNTWTIYLLELAVDGQPGRIDLLLENGR